MRSPYIPPHNIDATTVLWHNRTMNEKDLRVVRTRRLLKEAFIELAIEHGAENISIRDITKRAQVGYQTFYRHYDGKDDLILTLSADLLQGAQNALIPGVAEAQVTENTVRLLKFMQENAQMMQILLRLSNHEDMLRAVIAMGAADGVRLFGGGSIPDEIIGYHFVTGQLNLVRWWLENDMPYPAEDMANYINQIVVESLQNLARKHKENT